ncbi:MAG: hypothetical protein M1840_001029 [Geoglossum simile]|nr:MAG: hypothetical protein M1840_001029 [Geoglossum simile]
MEDPDLIATLIPFGKLAERAFRLPHNSDRYLKPAGEIAEPAVISSREPTPTVRRCKRPMNIQQGYSFGTSSRVDLSLGRRGTRGISTRHFCISFNEQGRVILKDSSTWGTTVSYGGKARDEVRHNFTWILSLGHNRKVYKDIIVRVNRLRFKVELASHETCGAEYLGNVNKFLEEIRATLPPFDMLGIYSQKTTAPPSQSLSPKQRPIYILERELGTGAFGRVDEVVDVSTGSTYARKTFFRPYLRGKNQKERTLQQEGWQERVAREIRILRSYPHEHIVRVLDFSEEPVPLLVMPYFPLGSLEDQHEKRPIAGLEVLDYLHRNAVTHRDIKPANILVDSRDPLSIKVADFGLAKETSDLVTFCGTRQYLAPEAYCCQYTPAMDLWPLGLMVLQYAYGIKELKRDQMDENESSKMKEWGLSWCSHIIKEVMDWESDPLIDLLRKGILKMDPNERLSAGQCLKEANDLRLYDSDAFGSTTPIRQTTQQGEIIDDDNSTTIRLGSLWDPEETLTQLGSPGYSSEQRRRNEERCKTRTGIPGTASEQRGGNSNQALAEPQTNSVNKRHRQTVSPSHPASKRPKHRNTVPDANGS